MRSIRGALTRPSRRSTTRLPFTRARVGTVSYAEVLRQLGLFVDVDLPHLKALALRARDVRDEALHPPRGAGVGGAEEDEQQAGSRASSPLSFPCKEAPKP